MPEITCWLLCPIRQCCSVTGCYKWCGLSVSFSGVFIVFATVCHLLASPTGRRCCVISCCKWCRLSVSCLVILIVSATVRHLLAGFADGAVLQRHKIVEVVQMCRAEVQRHQRHRALQ